MHDAAKKVLRVGLVSPPRTLNPRETFDLVSAFAVANVFETPYHPPAGDGPAVPVLFDAALRPLEGGMLAGRVRPGSRLSDGTPVTAQLVAASLGAVTEVTAVAKVDARGETVIFTPIEKNPRFDLVLTQTHCGVAVARGARVLGSGPYMFAPTSRIDAVRLVRNPFARLACDIDEIAFTVYPPDKDGTPRALLKALDDGEVDFTTMLSRSDVANVKGVRKLFQPSNSTAILYLNSERPRLNDVRVRRAIALGLDRVALAAISYSNALAFTANGLLPPAMGASRDALPFDRAAALRLLSEAGVTGGRLRLVAVWAPRPYLPNPQPVADAIAQQLGALGFSVDVTTPKGPEEFFDVANRGDYDLLLAGWIADTPDPADFLEVNLRSDRVPAARATSASAVNRGRLRDKTMDEALRRFREQPTPAHRDEVMRLTAELCPLLPLLHGPNVVVHAFGVHEVDVSIQGVPWFHTGRLDP